MNQTKEQEPLSADSPDDAAMPPWFADVVEHLLQGQVAVPLFETAGSLDLLDRMPTPDLRRLYSMLLAQGYLRRARSVADELDGRNTVGRSLGDVVRAELAVLRGTVATAPGPLTKPYTAEQGRILNLVGTTLPDVDSSYTRRTHALATSARRWGLVVSVASQMGLGERETYDIDDIDGVSYHRIPGPARGSVPFDTWLQTFVTRFSAVVRKVRPAAVVASSDFVNGLAAESVCRTYGIPFVYDVRGLWEDSWLSRQKDAFSWSTEVLDRWGAPDRWSLRRERETALVRDADAVMVSTSDLASRLAELTDLPRAPFTVEDLDVDVVKVVDLFESVGAIAPGSSRLASLVESALPLEDIRRLLRQAPRRRLDNVTSIGGRGSVESIRQEGWRLGSLDPVVLDLPFDWISACQGHRSQGFQLHAWDFMVPFLERWDREQDAEALDWCIARAVDWSLSFNDGGAHATMAWYDMALALRAPRLAYLLQEAVHEGADDEVLQALGTAVLRHQVALFSPASFNPRNNHGFYTAVGQLSFTNRLSVLPGMDIVAEQAQSRLGVVVSTQFATDGGHTEHSPDYHRMLLGSFRDAMEDDLLTDPEVASTIERAQEVMGWFIQPDRRIVQIGDSPAREAARTDRAMGAPHTAFLASGGQVGEPNPVELLVLPRSGYAFVRSPQPSSRTDHRASGYLTLMGGFHSRTHKHCDDLSVTWFDAGRELLIDAGRFGYLDALPADSPDRQRGFFYGRPERQFVESTPAHNTVEVDGRDHERRHRTPYGAAPLSGEQVEGCFRVAGEVDHGHWRHHRVLTFRPGCWLVIDDDITFEDETEHDVRAWFNLPGELMLSSSAADSATFAFDEGVLTLVPLSGSTLVPPVRGQRAPLRGWRSQEDYDFQPAWSLAFQGRAAGRYRLSTLLSLDPGLVSRPEAPFDPPAPAPA